VRGIPAAANLIDRCAGSRDFLRVNFSEFIPMLPFALLLGAMAIGPVLAPKWWARHYPKIALGLGAIIVVYLLAQPAAPSLGHAAQEYIGFIALIGALFVVAGGIHLEIPGTATPSKNVLFLFVGALLANLLGTTGAAMLLIRPWLRLNQDRPAAHHVVFFIFLVANVGGCLTPIGDPPLFLGFLKGIPFGWVAKNCWPMWAVAVGALLAIFYVVDKIHLLRAEKTSVTPSVRWRCDGLGNLFFLAVILAAVFVAKPFLLREGLMLAAAAGSYFTTNKSVHAANQFNFHPLNELAVLFAGIFVTMIPALAWLDGHAAALLGNNPSPGIFFWGTGALSSVLDNAPTYLGFFDALQATAGAADTDALLAAHSPALAAISTGAVFFGAASYIGNGPNFMVKSLAEQAGAATPTFLEYVWQFTLPLLVPVLALVWWLFFRA
jgi:Na+/H+ antiporter NhaD/arsenite permease-like protein